MKRLLEEYSSILIAAIPACALLAMFSGWLSPWFSNVYPDITRIVLPVISNSYDYDPILNADDTLEVYTGSSNTGNDSVNIYLGDVSFSELEARLLESPYVEAWENSASWEAGDAPNGSGVTVTLTWWEGAELNYSTWSDSYGIYQVTYCVTNNTSGYTYYKRVSLLVTEYRDRVV